MATVGAGQAMQLVTSASSSNRAAAAAAILEQQQPCARTPAGLQQDATLLRLVMTLDARLQQAMTPLCSSRCDLTTIVRGIVASMAKRGRPSLNLTPEERIQRRRLQLVASQRKRRAHKRLALQLSKAEPEPKPDTEPSSLPQRPDEAELCRYYDAVFLGQDEAVPLSSGSDAIAAETKSTARTTARTTTGNTTKTSTRIVINATRSMSSPDHQAPLMACHPCGSAPPDATSETSMASAPLAAVVGPHSRTRGPLTMG
ncbi:hypothetical protein TgHK011_003520 [Trichoderma gracile]|nr:hypothetical protein TgHK011_003520 [Trichoderma gracile]